MSDDARFGLDTSTVRKIQGVLTRFPQIDRAMLYGSRAKGNFRAGSDIDLALVGADLNYVQLLAVERALDELLLPYKIDLSLFHQIENPDLVEHIRRVGIVFWERRGS